MSANLVTFDTNRLTTSEKYLSHLADAGRSIGPSKQESQDRPTEYSRSQTPQVQVSDTIAGAKVTFSVDRESQELYIRVIDRETGEVLREIPPGEIRRLASSLKETFGNFLDSFA
jgi:flagellar protein FlaG